MQSGDFVDLLISSDGSSWHVIKSFTYLDPSDYTYYEFDITPYISSNFWIAFDSEINSGNYLYVDEIIFTTNDTIDPPQDPPIPASWHIQYNPTPTNPQADVEYWNLDLFDVSSDFMENLSNAGTFVMCYFSAGSWEDWRPDQDQFPEHCKGNNNGWPGEKWIDTNCPEVRQIMINRMKIPLNAYQSVMRKENCLPG